MNAATAPPAADRFLCPSCLCFGPLAFACGGCGREVQPLVVQEGGGYTNDCRYCGAALLPASREGACGVRAYCRRCRIGSARQPFHERWITVVVVPAPEDLAAYANAATGRWTVAQRAEDRVILDDGEWLAYVLCLEFLNRFTLEGAHAVRRPDALWLRGDDADALRLGERLDGFVRNAGLSASARKVLPVALGCHWTELVGEVSNVLRSRLPRVDFRRGPEVLLERLTRRPAQRVDQLLLVPDEAAEAALRAIRDKYGRSLLERDGSYRTPGGRRGRVLNLEAWSRGGSDPLALLSEVEAVWLPHGDPEADERRIAPLLRLAELASEAGQRIVVALEADTPPRSLRRRLEEGFRTVRSGVPAEEFLFNGAQSRPQLHGNGYQLHVCAACVPGDFERLWNELGMLQRAYVGFGWALEETGDRTTYLADFSDPARLPDGFGATPAPGEVQAVWISARADGALGLAERLDRLMRQIWNTDSGRAALTVCLEEPDPDPAIPNLLSARFGRVVFGVSAREFLDRGAAAASGYSNSSS